MTEKEKQLEELKKKLSAMPSGTRVSPQCQCYMGTALQRSRLEKQIRALETEIAGEKG